MEERHDADRERGDDGELRGDRDGQRDVVQQAFEPAMERALGQRAEREAGDGDAELARREEVGQSARRFERHAREPVPGAGHGLEPRAPRANEREFHGDEIRVQQEQRGNGDDTHRPGM